MPLGERPAVDGFNNMRCHPRRSVFFCLLILILIGHSTNLSAEEGKSEAFVLRESLGQVWRNECVRFDLTPAHEASVKAGRALVGPQGKAIAYQVERAANGGATRIAFAVDLDPFEERRYRFSQTVAKVTTTDVKIGEQAEFVELSNALTGISLRRKLKAGEGPIDGLRLSSGGWIGGSRLRTTQEVTDYSVDVTARGPVFAEAVCRAKFTEGRSWEMKLRVQANEPVVVVEETFATDDDSAFLLSLGTDYSPDRIFYRAGKNVVGKNSIWNIDANEKEPLFVLEPWLHWWERDRQGNWFGLYSSTGSRLVALGALEPGIWVDPAATSEKRSASQIFVTQANNDVLATFPLRGGRRKWMMATLDQDAALALPASPPAVRGEMISKLATLPQKYLIKHGDFPLDRVKEATAAWTDNTAVRSQSLVSDASLKEFQRRFRVDPDLLAKFRLNPIVGWSMDEPIAYYLASQDAELGRHLADEAVRLIQIEVDNFCRQNFSPTLGAEPHRRANNLLPTVNLAAMMLGSEHVSAEQSQRLKSQLAFLADTVTRSDFFSPARGYSANPNMTSTVSAFQVRIAGAIPSHPKAAEWMASGLNELKRELEQWSDDDGGWLEAPHYALVAFDSLLGCFLAAHRAGIDDVLYDPKMQKVAEWLAKISTPPDSRLAGRRHLPPIGNTYQCEPTSTFGHMAVLWRDKDPEFSARMQWMHRQQGSPTSPGIGGFYPTLAGFRTLLLDADLPATAPAWKSERFAESGVMFRSGTASARETQLYLIAGRLHDHYDDDSGSFTLWGKGRLLANDFGYTGHAPADDHNLIVSPAAKQGVMRVEEFTTTERFDSVRGTRDGWTRQIAFVKDRDPLGDHFFVVSDTLLEPAPMKWQLWLTANQVTTTKRRSVFVEGQEDVDLDIVFIAPTDIALRTEEKSRTSLGQLPDGTTRTNLVTTQTGLIADVSRGDRITAVLLPRIRTDYPAEIAPLADGKAVRVRTRSCTSYVFLAPKPFTFRENDISFEGTSGLIQLRGDAVEFAPGDAIRMTARNREFRSDVPTQPTKKPNPSGKSPR